MGCVMRMQTGQFIQQAVFGVVLGMVFFFGAVEQGWSQAGGPISQQPQYPGQGTAQSGPRRSGMDSPDNDPSLTKLADQQAKSRNSDRQKRLETDTQRLLALATELKEQVDKTDKNILSIDVIKKADEIEKLARSVKDRMKG